MAVLQPDPPGQAGTCTCAISVAPSAAGWRVHSPFSTSPSEGLATMTRMTIAPGSGRIEFDSRTKKLLHAAAGALLLSELSQADLRRLRGEWRCPRARRRRSCPYLRG